MSSTPLSRIVSDFETQLSGAIAVNDTTFTLQSVTDTDGTDLSDGTYCFTLERDNTSGKEYLVGQLTAATKTVSSVQSVGRQGGLTSGAQRSHRIGSNIIISDHSVLSAVSEILRGVGTLDSGAPVKYDAEPTLSAREEVATKGYVDDVVSGGAVTYDKQILGAQTAGETVAAGEIVYLKESDSRWYLADANAIATISGVKLGVAMGAGTAGNTISGGVQLTGICDAFTGLTANDTYYISDTAGAVATTAGTFTVKIGQAVSTTAILLDLSYAVGSPTDFVTTSAGAGDAGKGVKLDLSGRISHTMLKFGGTGSDGAAVYDGTTTVDGVAPVGGVYTINLASALEYKKNFSSISITGTAQIVFSNPHDNGTIVKWKSKGDVIITSTASPAISLVGIGALGGGAESNGYDGNGERYAVGGYYGVTSSGSGVKIRTLSKSVPVFTGAGGGGGSNGDGHSGGAGGRGAGGLYIECGGDLNITSTINASGSAATNGSGSTGTGGLRWAGKGGGGNADSPIQSSASTSAACGGGGGGGGCIIILYNGTLIANTATLVVTGGAAGGGGGGSGIGGTVGGLGYVLVSKNTEFC